MKKVFYSILILLLSCSIARVEEYACLYGNFDPNLSVTQYCNKKFSNIDKSEFKKRGITSDQWMQLCKVAYDNNQYEYQKGNCYKIIRTGETFTRNGKKCEKIKTKEYNMQGFECEDGYSELGGDFTIKP